MVKLLNQEGMKLSLLLEGTGNSYANAIRKTVNEIPILAIDTTEISRNDSVLFDEMLAHRLGLVPLKADKTYVLPEKCSCKGKGCLKCTVTLTLKAGNGMVNASELMSKTVSPLYPDMPLVFLQKGQEVEIVAEARLGKGTTHAKYSPGLAWIRASPHITLPKDKKGLKEAVEVCPSNVYALDGDIKIKNLMNCDLCKACVDEGEKLELKENIKVWGDEKDFILEIESWGQLSPKEIILGAGKVLKENIDEFLKELVKLK